MKKVVYVCGPREHPNYWADFEKVEDELIAEGFIPLSLAHLPEGLAPGAFMRIGGAMIESADAVLFINGGVWEEYWYAHALGLPGGMTVADLKEALNRGKAKS